MILYVYLVKKKPSPGDSRYVVLMCDLNLQFKWIQNVFTTSNVNCQRVIDYFWTCARIIVSMHATKSICLNSF